MSVCNMLFSFLLRTYPVSEIV